jgi:hypothetical protein
VSVLYETYLEVPTQGWNHSPSLLEPPRASAVADLGKPGQAEGTHAGAHTETAYAHASPQNQMAGSGQYAHLHSALALALALAAHALSTKSRSAGDLDAGWAMWSVACG